MKTAMVEKIMLNIKKYIILNLFTTINSEIPVWIKADLYASALHDDQPGKSIGKINFLILICTYVMFVFNQNPTSFK